jgi:hypothetical protein
MIERIATNVYLAIAATIFIAGWCSVLFTMAVWISWLF